MSSSTVTVKILPVRHNWQASVQPQGKHFDYFMNHRAGLYLTHCLKIRTNEKPEQVPDIEKDDWTERDELLIRQQRRKRREVHWQASTCAYTDTRPNRDWSSLKMKEDWSMIDCAMRTTKNKCRTVVEGNGGMQFKPIRWRHISTGGQSSIVHQGGGGGGYVSGNPNRHLKWHPKWTSTRTPIIVAFLCPLSMSINQS